MKSIVTHPGSAHKDDFLACCLLLHRYPITIFRREPTPDDLADREIAVVDVGGEYDEEKQNFDHHQFPNDSDPICALSLVLKSLGLYEDARQFCDWLEPAEWFDTRGPVATADWLSVERDILNQLNSPIDVTVLRRFAGTTELRPGDALWEVMRMVGEDLYLYLTSMRSRMEVIGRHSEFWTVEVGEDPVEILFVPRSDSMAGDASGGLERYVASVGKDEVTHGMIYPDRRGDGYALSRFEDSPLLDFTRIEGEPDVHFAHSRGFVAKTSATEAGRLRELVEMARVNG